LSTEDTATFLSEMCDHNRDTCWNLYCRCWRKSRE